MSEIAIGFVLGSMFGGIVTLLAIVLVAECSRG